MKNNKLAKAGSWYFIGNIFDKAVAFITVPIFTRLLSTAEYGMITTYLSWVSILSVVLTLCLGNSIRTAVVDYQDDKDGYMSSIFTLGTISSTIMSLIICLISYLTGERNGIFRLVVYCCVQSYVASIVQAVQWRYMMEMQYVKRTILQSMPNLVIVLLSILLIKNMDSDRYYGRIYASVLVTTLVAMGYIVYYFMKGRKFINISYWKYALGFSLPLIFHSLSQVILAQADRSMITWLKNTSETGIYGIAYQFGMVPLVFSTTLENLWIPWFTEKMKRNQKSDINHMVKPYVWIMAILCSGLILVSPEFLKLMTTKEYYSGVYMIGPVMAAIYLTFLASILIDLEYYLKKTKSIAINTLVAASINIVLNYIFIPQYGAVVAAYTTVVSYAVSFLMHYIIARSLDHELFPFSVYIIPTAIVFGIMFFSSAYMQFVLIRWGMGVILGIIFIIYAVKIREVKKIES